MRKLIASLLSVKPGTEVRPYRGETVNVEKIDPQREVALSIIEATKGSDEVSYKLSKNGIGELSFEWKGRHVEVSWYMPFSSRDVTIYGTDVDFNEANTSLICKAAYARALKESKMEVRRLGGLLPAPGISHSKELMSEMEVARSICEGFESGPITSVEFSLAVISEVATRWQGKEVRLSMYSTGRLRDVAIDGKQFWFGRDAEALILKSAEERMSFVFDEHLILAAGGEVGGSRESRRKQASDISDEICNAMQDGRVLSSDIDPDGISHVEVMWRGQRVKARWFSTGRGEMYMGRDVYPIKGYAAEKILKNAKDRARRLHEEQFSDLFRSSM